MVKKPGIDPKMAAPGKGERGGRLTIGSGLSVRSLEAFVTVANSGSMSAAAEQLGLTQPAVSQAISAMEASLGLKLFDRSTRPPALTFQAAALLRPAQAVIESLEALESALRLGQLAQLPSLRIGMLNSFAATMGPFMLDRLRHIATELTIESGFNATRTQAVVEREFDFVVTADESPLPPEVTVMPILTEPFLIVVPASYKGDMQQLKRLSVDLDFIRFGRDPFMISRLNQTLQSWGVPPQRRYHLDTSEAVLQMVEAGAGWTILPPLALYQALGRNKAIRVALYPETSMRRTIMVVFRRGEGLHVAEQIRAAALEALREHFLPNVATTMPGISKHVTLHEIEPSRADPVVRAAAP
jgi:DNA-binding transcriptional LysR family regulator